MDEVDILLTSIIILTYNNLEYTKQCLESIRKYTDRDTYELIIIDNNSVDDTKEWLLKQDDIRVIINKENLGFPRGCNQGIEIAKGENILLLNNDVIVTENWLSNMVNSLYSEDRIGAVGPVTNSAAYYTAIPVEYSNLNEMHNFAQDFNKSDSEKWEERLKLIGYCMLIKRDVVDKIGLLDERFTPGNFEDDDYSVRIRQAGYKLLLCKDTFIHHYGSVSWKENISGYGELLSENEKKFMEKWGTNSHSYIIHNDLIDEIPFKKDDYINVLHIGCEAGGTLLKIKDTYKKSSLYGIEKNKSAATEAERFANVLHYPVEKAINEYKENRFDVILITDWSNITNLQIFMSAIKNLLKQDGIILSSINNANHVSLINSLMLGKNPFLENRYMSLQDINRVFKEESGLKHSVKNVKNNLDENEKKIVELYCSLTEKNMNNQYETYKYIIMAQNFNEYLENNIMNIKNEFEVEKNLQELEQYSEEEIIDCILDRFEDRVQVLQMLAILDFSRNKHDNVLTYLHKAFELDNNNSDTLYNLGIVLYSYNEKEIAKKYLDRLDEVEKDEEVKKILAEVKFEEEQKKRKLVYLLRRLEHEIDFEDSRNELVQCISYEVYSEQEIMEAILNSTIDKEKVLNIVGINAFENGLNDSIFPFLNKAYELNSNNDDTLFNLGYILAELGENVPALSFLNKIAVQDKDVIDMIQKVKG
nr:glycosyltransferase [Cytobacillus praedii]